MHACGIQLNPMDGMVQLSDGVDFDAFINLYWKSIERYKEKKRERKRERKREKEKGDCRHLQGSNIAD